MERIVNLAIFDLDNTLLNGDSDYAWGQFLIEKKVVDGEEYERKNRRYYEDYKGGKLDIFKFLAFSLAPLSQHDPATLDRWHREFMETKVRPMITPAARQLVEKHRQAGDTLAIITATNRFVTAPIAREFGIEHLIATDPETRNGRYTGGVSGTPCYREGKVERFKQWLAAHPRARGETWFYSDSHNDLPLLERVDHPVAVNPDETLRQYALSNHWPILDLHEPSQR